MNQSVVWDRAAGITIEPQPEPSTTAAHVVLRVDASGLCGTDLHIAAGASQILVSDPQDASCPRRGVRRRSADTGSGSGR